MADLPDVNVLVALAIDSHQHHGRARRWWEEERDDALVLVRAARLAAVRVLSRAPLDHGRPLALTEAWDRIDVLAAAAPAITPPEHTALDDLLAEWIANGLCTARTLFDAHLAALALLDGHRLITFETDLRRFGLPALLVLD